MCWVPGDFELHDTQKTSAIGYPPLVGVTQGGNMDLGVEAVLKLATGFQGTPIDAREYAFGPVQGLDRWSKGEATGVHAEVLIIRAWIAMMVNSSATTIQGMTLANAITALRGRTITASQPACWCCARLMTSLGIGFTSVIGKKPSTGWRHPLSKITVPNGEIPGSYDSIDDAWLLNASRR